MKPAQIKRELITLNKALLDADLIIDSNYPTVQKGSSGSFLVSCGAYNLFEESEYSSLDEYLIYLRNRCFFVIFKDGSLLQISYKFRRSKLIGHRLCFFPCPIKFDFNDLEEFSLDEIVELSASPFSLRLVSPIRFDFDPEQEQDDHPSSHLHFSCRSCRVPVQLPLSIGHFLNFVLRNFYLQEWDKLEKLQKWPYRNFTRTFVHEKNLLFVSCTNG